MKVELRKEDGRTVFYVDGAKQPTGESRHYSVTLNGCAIGNVVAADEAEGTVVVGYGSGYRACREIKHGAVKITDSRNIPSGGA